MTNLTGWIPHVALVHRENTPTLWSCRGGALPGRHARLEIRGAKLKSGSKPPPLVVDSPILDAGHVQENVTARADTAQLVRRRFKASRCRSWPVRYVWYEYLPVTVKGMPESSKEAYAGKRVRPGLFPVTGKQIGVQQGKEIT